MKMLRQLLAASAFAIAALTVHGQPANSILAVVHDSVINRQEVDRTLVDVERELRRQHRNQPQVYYEKLAEARSESLEQLLERKLILHEFNTAGYVIPESVNGWSAEDKKNYSFEKWWENVTNPHWDSDTFVVNYVLHPY